MDIPTLNQALSQGVVKHAEVSRAFAMMGFTVLVWDHICTFQDEVELLWSAPRSLVKVLLLGNRYLTPMFMAMTICEMSRLYVFSDEFCKIWVVVNGFAEIFSIATSDLLLLLRVHVLWGKRRDIVVGTLVLYILAYASVAASGLAATVDVIPHLRFDPLARQCFTNHNPKVLAVEWAASLALELFVLFMTAVKVLEHRRSEQTLTPLMKALFYDQLTYYIIIAILRVFNLVIWLGLAQSLFFLGIYFIWALMTAMVSRIMLHLRRVAVTNPQLDSTSFFGESIGSSIVFR